MQKSIAIISFFLLLCYHTDAQKKALGRPNVFEHPYDYSPNDAKMNEYIVKSNLESKNKKDAWLVISDRDNNTIYDKPGGSSKGVVNFRDWFYVTNETDDFIEIIEASGVESNLKLVNVKKIVGWIPKNNVILWNTALKNPISKIRRKVIVSNSASDIENMLKSKDHTIMPIYNRPDTDEQLKISNIPTICFILKVDTKSKRFLISSEEIIGSLNVEAIIGWVEDRHYTRWDGRICLTPNYSQNAIEERQKNNQGIKFWEDDNGVRDYFNKKGGHINTALYSENTNQISPKSKFFLPVQELLRNDIFKVFCIGSFKFENSKLFSLNTDSRGFHFSSDEMAKKLNDYIGNGKEFNNSDTIDVVNLLIECYVPKKYPNTKSDLFKYVVFMSENDLREYRRVVSKGIVSASTYDKKRELLFEIYKEIIVQFAGEKRLREKKAEEWTREEMFELMQGIHQKGFQINGVGLDIRIADIKDEKKTPNQVIDELLLRFKEIDEKLSSILRNSDTYEYAYTSDQQNVYYWIEMSDLTF